MNIKISTVNEYIPTWNKNKKAYRDEQITVVYKSITPAAKEILIPKNFTNTLELNRRKLLEHINPKIKNLTVSINGEDKKIETVHDLYDAPIELDGLIAELFDYFFHEVVERKLEEKKFV